MKILSGETKRKFVIKPSKLTPRDVMGIPFPINLDEWMDWAEQCGEEQRPLWFWELYHDSDA